MNMNTPLIELKNVSKTFKMGQVDVHALNGVSLRVNQGESLSIMGPSGSGKTTLLHVVGCLLNPSSGRYSLNSQKVEKLNQFQLARIRNRNIGFVFQVFNLLPRFTALENVELPLIYNRISPRRRRELAEKALAEVGLSKRMRHRPSQLSGGEQQRVAIARALVNNPSIILADEPTGNLDSESGKMIIEILLQLNHNGKTLIIVTHEKSIAERAGQIVKLLDGRRVE